MLRRQRGVGLDRLGMHARLRGEDAWATLPERDTSVPAQYALDLPLRRISILTLTHAAVPVLNCFFAAAEGQVKTVQE